MNEIIIGAVVAVLAIGFVIFVIVKSILDKKKGKTCCGDCSSCSCCLNKIEKESK